MYQVIIVIHVLLGLGVIGLVLMQQGKGADAGAAFGSGSAGSVFGAQGAASFLSRSTAILASLFFSTSLALAVINGHKGTEHDLMATPAAESNSGIPTVQGAKNDVPVAAPADTQAPTALPTVPPVSAQPVDGAETPKVDEKIKPVEVAKPTQETKPAEVAKPAEQTKPVAEKKPVETTDKKPVAKDHKPAAKDDKKADTHKGKDSKKDN
jgi:preprotein translocase subunit SecG